MTPVVGLLVCDHVAPELSSAASGRDYPEMYQDLLCGAEPTLGFTVMDAVGGELPTDPGACDGWVVTGSRFDAFGSDPWLAGLAEFLREAHHRRARVVGVCFGHQMVAQALGGKVERARSWKAGPQRLEAEDTAWYAGAAVTIHGMHRDEVTVLPPGARPVGRGTTAATPIYVVEENVLCIQDHPEFDDGYARALVERRRERLGEGLADAALEQIGAVSLDRDLVARWLVDFLLDRRL